MATHLYVDFSLFEGDCIRIKAKMIKLGSLIIENMMFEHVEDVFMEKDFLKRNALNLITIHGIKPFIVKSKLRFLLDKIWAGKDSSLIDGKLSHFSKTCFLLSHSPKRLPGAKIGIKDLIGNSF